MEKFENRTVKKRHFDGKGRLFGAAIAIAMALLILASGTLNASTISSIKGSITDPINTPSFVAPLWNGYNVCNIHVAIAPKLQNVPSGTNVFLNSHVVESPACSGDVTYQWYNASPPIPVPIPGATSSTFNEITNSLGKFQYYLNATDSGSGSTGPGSTSQSNNGNIHVYTVSTGCTGTPRLQLTPDPTRPSSRVNAVVTGLQDCNGVTLYIKPWNGCSNSTIIASFISGDKGGATYFESPYKSGLYGYWVCGDGLNGTEAYLFVFGFHHHGGNSTTTSSSTTASSTSTSTSTTTSIPSESVVVGSGFVQTGGLPPSTSVSTTVPTTTTAPTIPTTTVITVIPNVQPSSTATTTILPIISGPAAGSGSTKPPMIISIMWIYWAVIGLLIIITLAGMLYSLKFGSKKKNGSS